MNSKNSDSAMERRAFQVSCERCRKRKIKCDRLQPCTKCEKAGIDCTFIGTGEKQRPVSRGYVQALEGQIASLEKFITKLIAVNGPERDEMLANFGKSSNHFHPPLEDFNGSTSVQSNSVESKAVSIRATTGYHRRLKDGKAAEFYGPTSFFQISPSDEADQIASATEVLSLDPSLDSGDKERSASLDETDIDLDSQLAFSPQSQICRTLMATFFRDQYQYHMCLYREYFLRDYDAGEGPYYSDLLMYAVCAMGALASEEIALRELSDVFFNRAQQLLYGSALESPNLTTLQALLLLGHREIGQGKMSKGWLFSGMAFRLAHEMGLHLDPSNWKASDDSRVEREILRRTYWAAFVADKHLSLYFGRPPALYPGQSDVNNTARIPYPPEWESLLNTYIMQGTDRTTETAYEDGLALVAGWVHNVELCKILHRMIIEVFENRSANTDETVLATSVKDIDVALKKWSASLPAKLHWNQWSVGPITPLVLHLHMMYHTALIILHRPPRNLFRDPAIATSEDVQTCYDSLDYIVKLIGVYNRQHQYSHLPLTFVHILASAASVILMKRCINGLSWDASEVTKPLGIILDSLDSISQTWPCAKQVRSVIDSAMKEGSPEDARNKSPEGFDLMTGLTSLVTVGDEQLFNGEFGFNMDDADIGFYMNDDFLNDPYQEEQWSFP